jgi:hypothetical protein
MECSLVTLGMTRNHAHVLSFICVKETCEFQQSPQAQCSSSLRGGVSSGLR